MYQQGEVSSVSRFLAIERASQEFEQAALMFKYLFGTSVLMLILLVITSVIHAKLSLGLFLVMAGLAIASLISFLNLRTLHSSAEELKKQSGYDV